VAHQGFNSDEHCAARFGITCNITFVYLFLYWAKNREEIKKTHSMKEIIMFTKHVQFLRTSLLGTAMLFAVLGPKSALATIGLKPDGNYDDGKLIWLKIQKGAQTYTHQQALAICEEKSKSNSDGIKWKLPTLRQINYFYWTMSTANDDLNLNGWKLNWTWASTETGPGNYQAFNLRSGVPKSELSEDHLTQNHSTCVTPVVGAYFDDGQLTWSRIHFRPTLLNEAKQYCANMIKGVEPDRAWRLPTLDELSTFAEDVVNKRKEAMSAAGWILGVAWTESPDGQGSFKYSAIDLNTGNVWNFKDPGHPRRFSVMCVR